MTVKTRIGAGILCLACTSFAADIVAQDTDRAEHPAVQQTTEFDVRLVQLDLGAVAELQNENGEVEVPEKWGVSFGFSYDGQLRIKPPVFFLGDDGELRIGKQVWQLGAALEDAERGIARPGSPFKVLSAPRIQCHQGQEAVISIGSQVEYLLRDDNGCLRPAEEGRDPIETEGVEIRIKPILIDEQAVEFEPVEVRLRRVLRREPVEGLSMDVGRPVMHEDHLRRDFRLIGDDVAVMLLSRTEAEAGGPIFVVISKAD